VWVLGEGDSRFGQMIDEISAAITQSPTAETPGDASKALAPEVAEPSPKIAGAFGGAAAAGGLIATTSRPAAVVVPLTPKSTQPPSWLDNVGMYASPVLEVIGQIGFAFILRCSCC
jgi:hypothetical protein